MTASTGLSPFRGYLGSSAAFRRDTEAINGGLMGFLCAMSRAVGLVFPKALYG